MKRIALIVTILMSMATTLLGAEALTSQSFRFKHKDAEKAAALIKPLMSAEGTVALKANTLVITDRADNVRNVAAALLKYDVAPQPFHLEVKLVAASRGTSTAKVPEDLRELSAKLSGVFKFNTFEKLGEINATVREGDPFVAEDVANTYRADFTLGEYDPLSDSVRVNDFRLQKKQGSGAGASEMTQLLKTSMNLKIGQVVVVGAARSAQSDRTLMVVIVGRRG